MNVDKELLAAQVMDRYAEFTTALTSSKRKYPMQEFKAFVKAVRLYAIATQDDQLIDRQVARVVTGLVDELTIGRKSVPGEMLYEADRLNCLLFLGYDPYFEGDEPPGL